MAEVSPASPEPIDLHTGSAPTSGNPPEESNDNASSTGSNDAVSLEVNFNSDNLDIQCPATPQIHFKLPDPTTSESDNEEQTSANVTGSTIVVDGNANIGNAGSSPPPNCAICLGKCKNKCFTDSCMHQFCFRCLCEWSKVKPECPLCKQAFKSIIHNVKSHDQFEEYHVQPPTVQIPHRPLLTYGHYLNFGRNNLNIQLNDWDRHHPRHSRIYRSERLTLFRNPTRGEGESAGADIANSNSGDGNADGVGNIILNPFDHRNELLEIYSQEFPIETITTNSLSQLWRRYVYDRNLYPMPLCDIMGRFRECTPRFYRDNPGQVDRLIAWVHRDLGCLLRNTSHDVLAVLERVKDSLFSYNILSPSFRRRLQPCLGAKTQHFIQELYNFARSPYDLIGYDRVVQYLPQNHESLVIEFLSSSEEDTDGLSNDTVEVSNGTDTTTSAHHRSHRSRHRNNSRISNPFNDYRVHGRTNLLSFTISTTSEGSEAPGVTVAVTGPGTQSTAINLTTRNRTNEVVIDLDESEVVDVIGENGGDSATNQNNNNNNTVPPSLGDDNGTSTSTANPNSTESTQPPSESQSIVPTENIELSSGSSDDCEFVLERKPPHLRTPELVSLNSESDSDVVFIEECKVEKPVYSRSPSEEKGCMNQEKIKSNKKCSSATADRSARAAYEREQFNVGASTSTGIRSSTRSRKQANEFEIWNNRLNQIQRDQKKQQTRSSRGRVVPYKSRGKRFRSVSSKDDSTTTTESSTSESSSDESYQRKARTLSEVFCKRKRAHAIQQSQPENSVAKASKKPRCESSTKKSKRHKPSASHIASSSNSEDSDSDHESLVMLKKRIEQEKLKQSPESNSTMERDTETHNAAMQLERLSQGHTFHDDRYMDYYTAFSRPGVIAYANSGLDSLYDALYQNDTHTFDMEDDIVVDDLDGGEADKVKIKNDADDDDDDDDDDYRDLPMPADAFVEAQLATTEPEHQTPSNSSSGSSSATNARTAASVSSSSSSTSSSTSSSSSSNTSALSPPSYTNLETVRRPTSTPSRLVGIAPIPTSTTTSPTSAVADISTASLTAAMSTEPSTSAAASLSTSPSTSAAAAAALRRSLPTSSRVTNVTDPSDGNMLNDFLRGLEEDAEQLRNAAISFIANIEVDAPTLDTSRHRRRRRQRTDDDIDTSRNANNNINNNNDDENENENATEGELNLDNNSRIRDVSEDI